MSIVLEFTPLVLYEPLLYHFEMPFGLTHDMVRLWITYHC